MRDDDDGLGGVEDRARPRGVLAAEADVDAVRKVRGCELRRIASVEHLRAGRLHGEYLVKPERLHFARQSLIKRRPLAAIQHGIVCEVRWRLRLVGGDEIDECALRHRPQRVIHAPLVANRRHGFLRDRLAAQRAGTVRRIYQRGVRQGQQLPVERVEQHAAEIDSRPAKPCAKIRTSDVANKQRVAGQDGRRRRRARGRIVNDEGDRFCGVPRSLEHVETHVPEIDDAAVADRRERVFGGGSA